MERREKPALSDALKSEDWGVALVFRRRVRWDCEPRYESATRDPKERGQRPIEKSSQLKEKEREREEKEIKRMTIVIG